MCAFAAWNEIILKKIHPTVDTEHLHQNQTVKMERFQYYALSNHDYDNDGNEYDDEGYDDDEEKKDG